MRKIEVWRFVPAYEGLYMVSNLGRVKSLDRVITYKDGRKACLKGMMLKQHKDKKGYIYVYLSKDGKSKFFYIHRLVAIAFIPNDDPDNKKEINHKDENKQNNCAENIEWCDRTYNINYSISTPIEVYKDGELICVFESQNEAARQLGLFQSAITKVLKGSRNHTGGYTFKYAEK